MRLGGFVINGNGGRTLRACLESLQAVCADVIMIDAQSQDDSLAIAAACGVEVYEYAWRGYGAARALAARKLLERGCDYLFFLDADEFLTPKARQSLSVWRESQPQLAQYVLRRRDLVQLPGRPPFLFRVEHKRRLIRRDCLLWQEEMLVHESLPRTPAEFLAIDIEHEFINDLELCARKQKIYAFLWAVRYVDDPKIARARRVALKSRSLWSLLRLAYFLRNAWLKGAFFRGGITALQVAWILSVYPILKYPYLRELRRGAYPEILAAKKARDYGQIFKLVNTPNYLAE